MLPATYFNSKHVDMPFRLSVVLLTLVLLALFSCRKEPDKIGLDLQPPGEKIGLFRTDTITIWAYSIPEDSVRTDKMSTITVGALFDSVFGRTTAGAFTELALTTVNQNFGTGAAIDSAYLSLAYHSIYGDTAFAQTFRIYELDANLHFDSAYYSNQTIPYKPAELASFTFVPNFTDSIVVDGIKKGPHLRIPLNQNFAARILEGSSEDFSTNEKFRSFFKGIYIVADPITSPGGALLRFNLQAALTGLTVYYHNNAHDSLKYSFTFGTFTPRFNHYNHHQYAEADPAFRQQVIEGDTTLGRQRIYLQPYGGVKVKLRIPYLHLLTNLGKNVVINEARIIFSNASPSDRLSPPLSLGLGQITDSTGKYILLPDQLEGEGYFGGGYNVHLAEYRFRLSRYVQYRMLNPNLTDYGLIMMISNASVNPQRVILYGGQSAISPIRMIVTYTLPE